MQILVLCIIFFIVLPTIILTVYGINLWKKKIYPKLQSLFEKESDEEVYVCVKEANRKEN